MIECKQSQNLMLQFFFLKVDNPDYSLPIRFINKLFQDITITYILTKFCANGLLFVDVYV